MSDIGIAEIAVILVVALVVFGPDRLPTMIKQASSFIADLRKMVANARRDLTDSVGDLGIDEEDLKTLTDLRNPKSYLRQKVLDGVDPRELGLDDFEELGDQLELNKRKGRRTPNGTGARRSGANGSNARRSGTDAGSRRTGTSSARTSSTGTSSTSDGATTTDDATKTAGVTSDASGVGAPGASPTGARFDPETT